MEKKKANETISVTPDSIFFRDIAEGDSDSVEMWIHNFGSKPVPIRLKMPADSPFSLSTSSIPMAAPGLETKITISYTAKTNTPVKSKVFVCSDESNILIPITAFPPCPRITPEKARIDLGTIGINEDFKFTFSLSNMGTAEGKFKLSSNDNSLTFMPSEGLILPSKTTEIGCNFKPQQEGSFSFSINSDIEGAFEPCPPIEVSYKSIVQSLSLMINDKEIRELNFETIYYGQKRVISTTLVNRGPIKQSFVVLPPKNINSNETVFTAVPSEGLLNPRGSTTIRFVFNPPIEKKSEDDSEISYNQYTTIEVVETSQKIEFQMLGKAVHHLVSLSSIDFNFEKIGEKQKSTQKLTIKNESHFLTTNFEIKPVAHFRFEPTKSTIKSGQSVDVNIIFYPKNLGTFELSTILTFCGGLSKKRINLNGLCEEENKPFKRVPIYETDQETRFNAMHPDTRFAYDLNEIKKNEEKRAQNDAYLIELENKRAEQIRKKEFNTRIRKDAESFLSRTVGQFTEEDVKDFIQTKLADEEYMKKFSSENVNNNEGKMERTTKINKEADNGLVPPDPPLRMNKKEPLFIQNPSKFGLVSNSNENSGDNDKMSLNFNKKEFQDENVMVKRKFKSKATTPAEVTECTHALTPAQQLLVRASHQTLNFGEISVFSQSTKSFSIYNGLQQHILVTLKYEYEEVADSNPASQVIPAGQIGGFDIKFSSTKSQNFMKSLQYTINGHHVYALNICATVVPIDVQLSRSTIDFRFTPDSTLPIIKEYVTLINKSNSNAEFSWSNISPPFFIEEKETGIVEANKSTSIEIIYRPTTKNRDDLSIICEIKGGYSRTLKCIGEVGFPRLSMVKKTANFGLIPIGIEKSLQLKVKNSGDDDAIFTIDVPSNSPELRVHPKNGRICAKDSIYLNVTYRAISAHSFDVPVTISACGCQKMTFNVTGKSELPDVQVCTTEFDFGRVYVGSSASIETQISNVSKIPAILVLDLSNHPDFRIEFASELADEFGEENASLISLVSDQTFVTRMEANRGEYAQNEAAESASSSFSSISSFSSSLTDDKSKKKKNGSSKKSSEKGLVYEIKLVEDSTIDLRLVFQPTEVADHSFELPMSLLNVASPSSFKLQPIVSAEGIEAPIVMSATQLDFGVKPIHDPLNPNCPASQQQIRLSSEANEAINWRIEIKGTNDEEVGFVVTPSEGLLNPSQHEFVKVQFEPKSAVPFNSYLSLFVVKNGDDKDDENLIGKVQLTGVGSSEMFRPSYHEVCMPIVPINTKSQMNISILNIGKIQSNLKIQLAVDENAFPVKISFPKGNQLLHTTEELPLNISFCSQKPLSFTTVVAVTDDLGNASSFILTCTCDNSVFTIFPYLCNENKLTKSSTFSKEFLDSAELQSRFLTQSDMIELKNKNWTCNSFSPVVVSFFMRYFNMLVLSSQLNEFPDDLVNTQGSLVVEAITNLAGGKKQQQQQSQLLGSTIGSGQNPIENNESNQSDSIAARRNTLKNLIQRLQSFGALLASIRPEFLMKKGDFMQLMKAKATKQMLGIDYFGAPDISSFDQKVLNELKSSKSFSSALLARLDVLETVYERLSIESWMTVILQVVKLFVMARVDPDKMGKVTGYSEAVKQSKAVLSKLPNGGELYGEINKSTKSIQNCTTLSASELSLLNWVTVHYIKSGGDIKRKFADFTSLNDSVGFSYLVRSHSTMYRAELNDNPASKSQIESNAVEFTNGLKKLQLPFLPKVTEIVDGSPLILAAVCEYFFETLPHYLPSTILEFNTSLHKPLSKAISLTNPSKNEIVYAATIEGDRNFTLMQDFATVGPGQTVDFMVNFFARTIRKVTARVTLIPSKPRIVTQRSSLSLNQSEKKAESAMSTSRGSGQTAKGLPLYSVPVVVEIQSNVTVTGPDETFTFETNVYSPKVLNIPVKNLLGINGLRYQIFTKVEKITDENGKQLNGAKNVSGTIESLINNPSEECQKVPPSESSDITSLITSHNIFLVHTKEINFDQNDSENRSIDIEFVPIELGTYRCLLLFQNEREGEFVYEIDAKSALPTPIEFGGSKVKTEAGKTFTFSIPVEPENQNLLRALAYSLVKDMDVSDWKFKDTVNRKVHELESIFRKSFESRLFNVLSSSQYFEVQNELNVTINSDSKSSLNVAFKPIKSGEYPCKIVLLSQNDVRVFQIKGIGLSATKELLLEFSTTFGKTVRQEVPFINPSDDVWQLKVNLKGDKSFTSPTHLNVKPKSQSLLAITFSPAKLGTFSAEMTVNNITKEATTIYKLVAKVDEPPAEDKIIVDCQARQTTTKSFMVKPFIKNGQCEVTSTVPLIEFNSEITFEDAKEAEFTFSIHPPRSGVSAGTVTFTDTQTGNFIWYILEVHIAPPAPEGSLEVVTEARKGVDVPIQIKNDRSFPVTYKVTLSNEEELHGQDHFTSPPTQKSTYVLNVTPIKEAEKEESIRFYSDEGGEFWYVVKIKANSPQGQILAPLTAPIGKTSSVFVTVENMSLKACAYEVENDNANAFQVVCKKTIQLSPGEVKKIEIRYTPTSVGSKETARVCFRSAENSDYEFHLTGTGKPPQPLSPTIVTASTETPNSALILFTNPFSYASRFSATLTGDNVNFFHFLIKKLVFTLNSYGEEYQIPFTFTPDAIGQFKAHIVVSSLGPSRGPLPELESLPSIRWVYPVIGNATETGTVENRQLKSIAHASISHHMSFTLVGESESYEFSKYKILLDLPASLDFIRTILELKPVSVEREGSNVTLNVKVNFSPRRPFNQNIYLVIENPIGQQWRFPLELSVDLGKPCDTIVIESLLNKTGCAKIRVPSRFRERTPFHAYFAAGSASEFSVSEAHGMIEPNSSDDEVELPVEVVFAPKMYGKILKGLLIVDTLDAQFLFDVVGKTPDYVPPVAKKSSIESKRGGDDVSKIKKRTVIKDTGDGVKITKPKLEQK